MKNKPYIGIYDSGLGGLTVLKEFQRKMPNYNYIYYGDTAHVPYGNKSKESILAYSLAAINFFEKKDVCLIVIACNTVSSLVFDKLQAKTQIQLVNVIKPLSTYFRSIVQNEQNIKVGVIGTTNTINSNTYEKLLQKINKNIYVYSKACPMFVPIIEFGFVNHQIADILIKEYLKKFLDYKIKYLILACTHYPILKNKIYKYFSSKVIIIDSATITAKFTKNIFLKNNQFFQPSTNHGTLEIYVTDQPGQFEREARQHFEFDIQNVKQVKINS